MVQVRGHWIRNCGDIVSVTAVPLSPQPTVETRIKGDRGLTDKKGLDGGQNWSGSELIG